MKLWGGWPRNLARPISYPENVPPIIHRFIYVPINTNFDDLLIIDYFVYNT